MKRKFNALPALAVLLISALSACSHKQADAPLSYVPTNTPFLVTNLKPMPVDMRKSLLKQTDWKLQLRITQMRALADELKEKDKPGSAALLRAFAAEFDGRTMDQAIHHMGFDIAGLYAIYGVGMSPVARFQITDSTTFEAFIGRIEKALGTKLAKASIGNVKYRHADLDSTAKLQVVVMVKKKQALLALLPANADNNLLRMVLGLKRPDNNMQDSGKLKKLAADNGYLPYSLIYFDFRQLPALIAGEKDPMIKVLLMSMPSISAKITHIIPASCEADFKRIASIVPMISSGMTAIAIDHFGYRTHVTLAANISKILSATDVKLPGLGSETKAPLDIAIALPVKEIRTFFMAQADAVAAKPFTCPVLTSLNTNFTKLREGLQKAAVLSPINDLRGLRVTLDHADIPNTGNPVITGRVLLASNNPEGMLAMAQVSMPTLRHVRIAKDGKPVALPATLTRIIGKQPAWAAMTDHVLAVGLGTGEDQRIAESLKAPPPTATGTLARFYVGGGMYRKWVDMVNKQMTSVLYSVAGSSQNDPKIKATLLKAKQKMKKAHDFAEHIDGITEKVQADDRGVTVDIDIYRH